MKIIRLGRNKQTVFPPDSEGKSLIFRASELEARLWLIDLAEEEYNAGNFDGAATLLHMNAYLADRFAYELCPWHKGCIPVPQ